MYGLVMTQSTCPFGPGYDFTDPDVLLKGIPVTEFAELRKTAPVWWNEQSESIFDDGGYWVISRHEDIKIDSLCSFHRSEEHTSELQSLRHLVCRLLLEKKKKSSDGQIRAF